MSVTCWRTSWHTTRDPDVAHRWHQREDGSESPVAHMCGHDAHVTWMLGMAKAMVAMKGDWSGPMVLIGQPAEEPITGAQAMVDVASGPSTACPSPTSSSACIPRQGRRRGGELGPKMAGTDQIDILFKGVGGHGSIPQLTKNPVLMAAMAVVQYQAIVSRTIEPRQTAVLAVGSPASRCARSSASRARPGRATSTRAGRPTSSEDVGGAIESRRRAGVEAR